MPCTLPAADRTDLTPCGNKSEFAYVSSTNRNPKKRDDDPRLAGIPRTLQLRTLQLPCCVMVPCHLSAALTAVSFRSPVCSINSRFP